MASLLLVAMPFLTSSFLFLDVNVIHLISVRLLDCLDSMWVPCVNAAREASKDARGQGPCLGRRPVKEFMGNRLRHFRNAIVST